MSSKSGRPKDRFDRRRVRQEKDRNPYGGKRVNKPSKKEVKHKFDTNWGDDDE